MPCEHRTAIFPPLKVELPSSARRPPLGQPSCEQSLLGHCVSARFASEARTPMAGRLPQHWRSSKKPQSASVAQPRASLIFDPSPQVVSSTVDEGVGAVDKGVGAVDKGVGAVDEGVGGVDDGTA